MTPLALPFPIVERTLAPLYRTIFHPSLPPRVQRILMDAAALGQPVPRSVRHTKTTLAGRPAETAHGGASGGQILYLHGGGCVVGSLTTHRSLVAGLAMMSDATVHSLAYRLAPEHPYPAAVDDAVAAYLELLDLGGTPETIAISGDSAGGGLALATAQRLIADHAITPAALGLIAPWVDPFSDTEPTSACPKPADIVVTYKWGQQCARRYRGSADNDAIAPLRHSLAGLPPTLVQVGLRERLYPQDLRLVQELRAAKVDVTLAELPRLWHVAHAQWALVSEARAALADLAEFLRHHLDAAPAGI